MSNVIEYNVLLFLVVEVFVLGLESLLVGEERAVTTPYWTTFASTRVAEKSMLFLNISSTDPDKRSPRGNVVT